MMYCKHECDLSRHVLHMCIPPQAAANRKQVMHRPLAIFGQRCTSKLAFKDVRVEAAEEQLGEHQTWGFAWPEQLQA